MTESMHITAVAYARAGFSVHPLPPGEKKSRLMWAERQRVAMTVAEIDAHWAAHPDDNVAIITGRLSGLVVVDVDPAHGGDPQPFLDTTPVVARTRSGGWHFYYRHPGRHVKSAARPNPDLPGVDVRGDGGYVVAPPSRVEPGAYTWESPGWGGALPPFEKVEHLIFPRPGGDTHSSQAANEGGFAAPDVDGRMVGLITKGAPIGAQRQALLSLAGMFAGRGLPSDIAYAMLFSWVCRQKQRPGDPWMPHHVKELVESIYDRESRRSADCAGPQAGSRPTTAVAAPADGGSDPGLMELVWSGEFLMRHGSDFNPGGTSWLVEDWLPEGTLCMVTSPPGAYKTWLLLDLAASIGLGQPFLQRYPVHGPGKVVVVQQEDPRQLIADRFGLLARAKQPAEEGAGSFRFLDTPEVGFVTDAGFMFGSQPSRDRLVAILREHRPRCVIIDPLYSACSPGQFFLEMTDHLKWLRRLRDRYGTTFVLAHHTKKQNAELGDQGREQMFGSNLMNAAIESGWIVRPAGEHAITVRRHFKVAANIERRKFTFTIDTQAPVPFLCEESTAEDPAVDAAERSQLDATDELILATLRTEGPRTMKALCQRIEKNTPMVSKHVGKLAERGLLAKQRGKTKREVLLSVTPINPKEVA